MHYVVFDLEWNIAGYKNRVHPDDQAKMPHEIIEIGAVRLDESFDPVDRYSTFIKPKLYPILSSHIAAVTNRLQQSMKYGQRFDDAAHEFLDWCGEDYLFCTWTESDTSTLKMNMDYYEINHALTACVDAQYLFDARVERAGMQRSIEYAVDFLQLDKKYPFHQAVNDAWYTGQIFKKTVEIIHEETPGEDWAGRYAFDPNIASSYQIDITGPETLDDVMTEVMAQNIICPACERPAKTVEPWKTKGSRQAQALFACPEHGRIRGKCRIRHRKEKPMQARMTLRLDRDQGA